MKAKKTTTLQSCGLQKASIGQAAKIFFGKPNAALSKAHELRFGNNGSVSVDLKKGLWYNFENSQGGDIFQLIRQETGISDFKEQLSWLQKNNILKEQVKKNKKPTLEAIYEYRDSCGKVLFEVLRYRDPKTFKQRRPTESHGYSYSVKGVKKVPFLLPELLAAPESTLVFIVEGEKDALRLSSLGLIASCNSGGAGKWPNELNDYFSGRQAVVIADNDSAGQEHAKKVASKLALVCSTSKLLLLPGLPDKGDVSDWLDSGGTVEQLLKLADKAMLVSSAESCPDDDESPSPNAAEILLKTLQEKYELFHDDNKSPFARDISTGEAFPLSSKSFQTKLLAETYYSLGIIVRDQSMREAISTASGLGRFMGKQQDVCIRFAKLNDHYYLDLGNAGDNDVICLQAGGWEVKQNTEAYFYRPEAMQALPTPVSGGEIDKLWSFIKVKPQDQLLLITLLIEYLRPDTPHPVLELTGEMGSGKSFAQTCLRRLVDPSSADLRSIPSSVQDLFIAAHTNALLSLENVSSLSLPLQDAMCIIATGGGYAKRKLYSDFDEVIVRFKRPILLNGIVPVVTAHDLVDRTISLHLPTLDARVEHRSLTEKFDACRPHLLGALLDTAAKALILLPKMVLPAKQRPRLLEYCLLGMAVATALGRDPKEFLQAFTENRNALIARTIEEDPVGAAILALIAETPNKSFVVQVSHLLKLLQPYRPPNSSTWPSSARALGNALRRVAPVLRQAGVECTYLGKGSGGVIRWKLEKAGPEIN